MDNTEVIKRFYTAFSKADAETMGEQYDENATFVDPAFGELKGIEVKKMWEMLLSKNNNKPQIEFFNIESKEDKGTAEWRATYFYGPKKRKVVNHIKSSFNFYDGKIINQIDHFNLWKWTRQALGLSGYLLGWSSFMKKKIQAQTNKLLRKYINDNP